MHVCGILVMCGGNCMKLSTNKAPRNLIIIKICAKMFCRFSVPFSRSAALGLSPYAKA